MPGNTITLGVDLQQAKSELQTYQAQLAAATAQAIQLREALKDTTGGQRSILQGALAGTMSQIGRLQTSLSTAQSSAIPGGNVSATVAGGVVTGLGGASVASVGLMLGGGVAPMSPGTLNGSFGASGYNPTARFAPGIQPGVGAQPTIQMPTMAMMPGQYAMGGGGAGGTYFPPGGGNPTPGMDPTMMFTAQQRSAANYAPFRQQMGLAAAYGVARSAGDYFNYQADRSLQGGDDPIGRARGIGGGISTAIGIGVGLLTRNPLAGVAAAGVASTVIDPMARWWGAPEAAGQGNSLAARGFFGSYYGTGANSDFIKGYSQNTNLPWQPGNSRFAHLAQMLDPRLPKELQFGAQGAGMGAMFSSIAGGLFAGGNDPMAHVGSFGGTRYPLWNFGGRTPDDFDMDAIGYGTGQKPSRFRLMDATIARGISMIKREGAPYRDEETLAGRYLRRTATLFGNDKDAANRMGAIFGALPDTGGNVADILGKFGPQDATNYLRIQNDRLESSIDPMTLSKVSAGMRSSDRQARLGSMLPTGSGAAEKAALARKMLTIGSLGPDALNSEEFGRAYQGYRGARGEEFEQGTLSGFGMRDVQLSEQRKRLDVMPFAPGNIFGNEIASINNRRGQIGRLGGMLQNTDLSERERYQYTAEREGLITSNYASAATLAEGFENRLPRLAAGTPAFFGRYNSVMGAGINMGRIGSPIRAYGAGNGRQAAAQDAFISALGGDSVPHSMAPYSRTGELNELQQMTALLRQLVQNTRGGGGASAPGRDRTPDRRGPDSVDPQQRGAWNSR